MKGGVKKHHKTHTRFDKYFKHNGNEKIKATFWQWHRTLALMTYI